MPSLGEIFRDDEVPGVFELPDVSEVGVAGACVGVLSGASVAVGGASVTAGVGVGVTALWQAARRKMERRNGIIFFMFVNSSWRGMRFVMEQSPGEFIEPIASPFAPGLHRNWDLLYPPFAMP